MKVNVNHEITTQKQKRTNFIPGFEPLSPGTESQCATNELCDPLKWLYRVKEVTPLPLPLVSGIFFEVWVVDAKYIMTFSKFES